jgi:uncharacterized RDD family membrane protein YckC
MPQAQVTISLSEGALEAIAGQFPSRVPDVSLVLRRCGCLLVVPLLPGSVVPLLCAGSVLIPSMSNPQDPVSRRAGYRSHVTNQQASKQQAVPQRAVKQQAGGNDTFYPGRVFGLPEFGAGSVAGWSRRLAALLIDWFACSAIAIAFLYHPSAHYSDVLVQPRLWTPVIFGIEDFLLTGLTGVTIGKRLLGIRVIRIDQRPMVGLARAFVRTLLLLLVVPAMMMDRDLRGLQDKAAGTIVVRS